MSQVANDLMERTLHQIERPSVEPRIKRQVKRELRKIRSDARLITRSNGYRDFLMEYIQTEYERYTKADQLGYEEKRDKPLCRCNNSRCDLKQGRVPLMVRDASSIESGMRQFEQEHSGRPVVLHDARAKWEDMITTVEETLIEVNIALTHNEDIDDVEA